MERLKKILALSFVLIFGLAGLTVTAARAQSVLEGKILGTITDDQGEALPGVSVQIEGPKLMGKKTAVTTAKGAFVFLAMPAGTYSITASLPGFKTMKEDHVILPVGTTITVNLVLPAGKIEETVTVTVASPVIDVKTSTIDSKINQDMLAKLPTSRDSWYDLSLTTPGMFDTGAAMQSSPTAYGESGQGNIFLVNGVDTTNPSGAGFGSMINVNYNTIQEVRVISLGSKAEFGNFSGAAIDVVTKSGSNTLSGSLSLYSQVGVPKTGVPSANSLGRDWLFVAPGTTFDFYPKRDWELDLTLGGPVIKDKLWFFAAGNLLGNKEKLLNWTPLSHWNGRYADIKISANPLKNHRAWVAYHYEDNNSGGTTDGTLNWDQSMEYDNKTKSQSLSAQWQWFPSTTTFLSAKFLGFMVDGRPALPSGHATFPGLINWWKALPTDGAAGGAFEAFYGNVSSRSTIQADLSHYAENFLGEHDIKFGVQYTRGRKNDLIGNFFSKNLTNPDTSEDLGLMGYYQFGYIAGYTYSSIDAQNYYYGIAGQDGLVMNVNTYYAAPRKTVRTADSVGFFFDDQWTPTKRLTFNIGVRYDLMTAKFGQGAIYLQPSTPEGFAGSLDIVRTRQGSGNLFDFKCFSPRLGLTYQLTKDGKTALRASYGRYYTPLGVESFGSGGPDQDRTYSTTQYYLIPWDDLDANGDGVLFDAETMNATRYLLNGIQDGTLTPINAVVTSNSGGELDYRNTFAIYDPTLNPWSLKVSPGLKNQHTDQFTISLEREIFPNFSLALTYINRDTRDMIVEWPINKVTGQPWDYEPKTEVVNGQTVTLWSIILDDYNGDGVITNGQGGDIQWVGQNHDIVWMNLPAWDGHKPRRLFQGLQLTFSKRYSDRWQLFGSLLWNHSSGPAGRNKRQDEDYNLEGSNIWSDHWVAGVNQLVNNMIGPLPFTPRFEFKINGNYTIPGIELDVALRFRLHTGRPVWVLTQIPDLITTLTDLDDTEALAHAVLTTGGNQIIAQDPTKPLYMPALKILDLRLEKSFRLGRVKTSFILDVFNLFNSQDVTNAYTKFVEGVDQVGQITGIVAPRKYRAGLEFTF
jgi:outer membrane receptor protein involved in Fe transport